MSAPFPRPDFYLPWPARVNPARDAAGERTRIWAQGIGMLEEGVWDAARFDAAGLAGAAAYCFPDTPEPLLSLIAQWGNWAFYVDDVILERFKRAGDAPGLRGYVEQSAALLGSDPPEPADAAQRGLADLWARTAPLMSEHWRARFAGHTLDQLRTNVWELENIGAHRVPNPVEYLSRRRGSAGGAWIAELVELANAGELRPDLPAERALRVLCDSFGDSFLLDNDLFSYRRETEEEGENSNGVLVLEHFLNLDPQGAAAAVNKLRTSRMQQFENTLLTEVPLLFEEHALGAADRLRVLAYAKGLQDFLAGIHRWMEESPRYADAFQRDAPGSARMSSMPAFPGPRGLGTAAARLFQAYRPVLPRPPRSAPAPILPAAPPAPSNPHLESVRPELSDWARRMGMLDGTVWSEEEFERLDVAGWSAATHPDAPLEKLGRIAKWYAWRSYLDAVLEVWFTPRRDYLGAKAYLSRISAFLPADGVSTPAPASALERALADLWPGSFAAFPSSLRTDFPAQIRAYADGRLWELANRAQGRVPDSVDYLEMRRHSAGQGFAADLVRYAADIEPEGEGLDELEAAVADIAAWRADLASYAVDVERDGSVNNGVLVLERALGASPEQAAVIARDLVAVRTRELAEAAERCDERYLSALRAWLAGSAARRAAARGQKEDAR